MLKRFAVLVASMAVVCAGLSVAQQYDPAKFEGMKYRLIGPFRGGRVIAVTGIPGNPYTFFFGGVAGGVWKTVDAGSSWAPISDKAPFASVGAMAVAESNPSVIYVGTGESCIRGNISYGNGVFKTTDGGKTWIYLGLKETQHIARVLVNPHDPSVVFVAALGHAYGPNQDRGVYKSTDGGRTWQRVLFKDDHTGAIDLAFDPHNPNVLFAAMYQVQRTPWSLDSGGPGSGLWRSVDGGNTWKPLQGHGLPTDTMGRIGVSVSGADSNRVYALVEAKDGGLFRSDDGGDSWTKINDDQRITQRAWYFTHIFADPKNIDTVYMLNTGLFRSTDGGKSINLLPAPHGDHHGLWIDPTNPDRMINGNDGGATISVDGGRSWSSQYTQPTAQFYHVAADNRFLYYLYGAQQDNTTVAIASRTDHGYIGRQDWYDVGGGESGYIIPDPRNANIVYAGSNGGWMTRLDRNSMQVQDITVWPVDFSGHGAKDLKFRQAWTDPIAISPHDPNVLYTGTQFVSKTTDGGKSWTTISPDLTRNDVGKQESSGGSITKDNTTVEYYDLVFTIAESPVQKNLIWAGTDDGLIQVTKDGGQHWANVTPKGIPEWSLVSLIDASPHDACTAYAAVDTHKLDNLKPYIYTTTDCGKSWTQITNGIPDGAYVHVVREDPVQKGLLFAGTETGIYVSFDNGANWQSLQLNLPQTPIHDLIVKNNDLAVATHGRSFWILDNITPLRQLGANNADLMLYKPDTTYRMLWPDDYERRQPVAPNPPNGAVISYFFKAKPVEKEEVKLEILDSQGKVIRNYSSLDKKKNETPPEWPDQQPPAEKIPVEAGLNRFTWDLRTEGPKELPGEVGAEYRDRGPYALPGAYQVRITMNGKSQTQPFELKIDPRSTATMADLQKQFDLEMKILDQLSQLHATVDSIRTVRGQIKGLHTRLGEDGRYKSIMEAGETLDKKMTPIEEQLLQVKIKSSEASLNYPVLTDEQLHGLLFSVGAGDFAPNQQQYAAFDELSAKMNPLVAQWKQIASSDLVALNHMIDKENVPAIYLANTPSGQSGSSGQQ